MFTSRYTQRPAVSVAPRAVVPVMIASTWLTPAANRTKFGHNAAPAARGGPS